MVVEPVSKTDAATSMAATAAVMVASSGLSVEGVRHSLAGEISPGGNKHQGLRFSDLGCNAVGYSEPEIVYREREKASKRLCTCKLYIAVSPSARANNERGWALVCNGA